MCFLSVLLFGGYYGAHGEGEIVGDTWEYRYNVPPDPGLVELYRQPGWPQGTRAYGVNSSYIPDDPNELIAVAADDFVLPDGGALVAVEIDTYLCSSCQRDSSAPPLKPGPAGGPLAATGPECGLITKTTGERDGPIIPADPSNAYFSSDETKFYLKIWRDEDPLALPCEDCPSNKRPRPGPFDDPLWDSGPRTVGDGVLTASIADTEQFPGFSMALTFNYGEEEFFHAEPGVRYWIGVQGPGLPIACDEHLVAELVFGVITSYQPPLQKVPMHQRPRGRDWEPVLVGGPPVPTDMAFALFGAAPPSEGGSTVLSLQGVSAGEGCPGNPGLCCIRVTPTTAPIINCGTGVCDTDPLFGANCYSEVPFPNDPPLSAENLAAALAVSFPFGAGCDIDKIEVYSAGPRLVVNTTDGTKPKLCLTINGNAIGIMGGPNDCAHANGCGYSYCVGPEFTLQPILANVDHFATVRGQCDLPAEGDTGTWIDLNVPGATFDRTLGDSPASDLVIPHFRLDGVARSFSNENSDTVIRRTEDIVFGRCSGDFSRAGADPTLHTFAPDGVVDQVDVDAFNECLGESDPFPGDCEFFDYDGDDVITSNPPLSGIDDDKDVLDCLLLAGNSPECCPTNLNLPQQASNVVITEMARWHLRGCDYLQVEREGSLWPENWVFDVYLSEQDPAVGINEVGPCENEFDVETLEPPFPAPPSPPGNDWIDIADNIGLLSEGEPRRIAGEIGNHRFCDFFNFWVGDMDADVYRFTLAFPATVNISTDAAETDPKCNVGQAALPSLWLYSSSGMRIANDDPPASRLDPTINREPSISRKLDEGEYFILVAAAGQIRPPDPTNPTGRGCSVDLAPQVDSGDGDPTGFYDLNIAVAPSSTLRVTKITDTDGTYEARTLVQPLYTYQKVGDPFQSALIDTGDRGDDAFVLESFGPWTNALPEGSDLRPGDMNFIPGALSDGSAPEIQLIETNEGDFGQSIVAAARRKCATIFDACGYSQAPGFDLTLDAVAANFVEGLSDTPVADNFSVNADTLINSVTFWVTPGDTVTEEHVFAVRVLGNSAGEGPCEIGIPDGSTVITEGVVGVPFIQPTVSALVDRVTLNLATPFTALADEIYWLELRLDTAETTGEAVQFVTSLEGDDNVGANNDNVFFHDVISQAGQEGDPADDCAPPEGDGYDCIAFVDDTETDCYEENPDGDQRIGSIAFCVGTEVAEDTTTKELPSDVICGIWRTAPGEIVWSQPFRLRADGVVGYLSDFTRGSQGGNQAADSFTFFETGTITGIKWHGTYTTNTPVPESDDFLIEFWDDGASVPDNLITSYSPTNAEIERVAGELCGDTGRQVYSYSYQLSPPLTVEADETVWVSVINNTEGQPYTWAFAIGGGGNSDGRAALRVNLDNDPRWETLPDFGDPPTDFSFEIQLEGTTKIITGDSVDCGGGTASGVGYHFDSLRATINGYQFGKPQGQIGEHIETTGNRWRNVSAPWKFMQHLDAADDESDLAVLFGRLHVQVVKQVYVDPDQDPVDVTVTQAEIDCLTAGVPGEKSIQSIFAGLAAYNTDPATRGISVRGSVNRLCDGAVIEALDPTLALSEKLMVKGVCWDNGTATAITSVPPSCPPPGFAAPALGVSFSDRAWHGYIDPRRESDDGNTVNQGLRTITIKFTTPMQNADGSPISVAAFSISDTAGTPPAIVNITSTNGGQTVTLELTDHITLQHWTTISFDGRSACGEQAFSGEIDIGYLPGDVNQNGCVNPLDVTRFRQYINDVVEPDIGIEDDYTDCNRNGSTNALDLTCLRQLMFGTGPATKVWGQGPQCLPAQP